MVRWKLLCHCERKGAADSALFQSAAVSTGGGQAGPEPDRRPAASGEDGGDGGPRFQRQLLASWRGVISQQKNGKAMTQQKTAFKRLWDAVKRELQLLHYSANLQLLSIIQAVRGRQKDAAKPPKGRRQAPGTAAGWGGGA